MMLFHHCIQVVVPCRFFTNRAAFEREQTLYGKEELREMMPAVRRVVDNTDGSICSSSGWVFPPFIIVEKGESLDEWALRISPDFPTVLTVLCHIAARLQHLHGAGLAHRDLKPANVLWRPKHHSWTLIDFGCAAEIGALRDSFALEST
jgi:serine/threonine protein kinase